MIAHIEGNIVFRGSRFVIVEAGGIGYRVFISKEAMKSIPEKGSSVKFFTHLHTREDTMELYGFLTFAELEFFELLISISGIGPKLALGVLGVAPLDSIKRAVAFGEVEHLVKVSGIGRKIAEKIVLELRDVLKGSTETAPEFFEAESDALDALVVLGYKKQEAREALKKVPNSVTNVEQRITLALKAMGKKTRRS